MATSGTQPSSTVLMAAGEPLPDNVIGVLADCGYSSARDIIRHVIRQMGLPPKLAYPFVKLGARIYGGFDPNEADCPAALARATVPVILFHGEADDFVPCEMSRENYAACAAPKTLIITADEVAEKAQTIGYELVCGITSRVPRVYLKNGEVDSVARSLPGE